MSERGEGWEKAKEWHDTECLNLQMCCNVADAAAAYITDLRTRLAAAEEQAKQIAEVIGWEPGEQTLLQAVTAEWHDFMMVVRHCSEMYDAASGGLISKPHTLPSVVIREMDERQRLDTEEAVAEETKELAADLDAARRALERLVAELSSVQIEAVREGCGNTNAACLSQRVDEARALLAPERPREESK